MVSLAAFLRFDKDHPWHRNLVSLYLSIIELSGCIPVLLDNAHGIGIPSIFRTLLETHIEFLNLSADKQYGNFMEASYSSQWLKLMLEAQTGINLYLKDLAIPDLKSRIAIHKERLTELRQKGYRELSVHERFEHAGQLDQYKSIYNYLCNNDHPNIRALIDRHIEINNKDFSLVLYKDHPDEKYREHIAHSCIILIETSVKIHSILCSGKDEALRGMMVRFIDSEKN